MASNRLYQAEQENHDLFRNPTDSGTERKEAVALNMSDTVPRDILDMEQVNRRIIHGRLQKMILLNPYK